MELHMLATSPRLRADVYRLQPCSLAGPAEARCMDTTNTLFRPSSKSSCKVASSTLPPSKPRRLDNLLEYEAMMDNMSTCCRPRIPRPAHPTWPARGWTCISMPQGKVRVGSKLGR
eukprot:scaffold177236_cov31-Prasinocladus_malaysianus.AAC.1